MIQKLTKRTGATIFNFLLGDLMGDIEVSSSSLKIRLFFFLIRGGCSEEENKKGRNIMKKYHKIGDDRQPERIKVKIRTVQ